MTEYLQTGFVTIAGVAAMYGFIFARHRILRMVLLGITCFSLGVLLVRAWDLGWIAFVPTALLVVTALTLMIRHKPRAGSAQNEERSIG